MKDSIKTGLGFGLTSGIITTLGLIVGLNSGTKSELAIISGILTIAIADSLSDALGMHISEESKGTQSKKQVWYTTLFTFISKVLFALSFTIPIILLDLPIAIVVSIIWGFLLLGLFSYYIARENDSNPKKVIGEHILIAIIVIVASHYVGSLINFLF